MEEADRLGFKPVYGDTDSVFIQMKESDLEKFLKDIHKKFDKIVKACNQDISRSKIKLEHEQTFRSILFIKKKRYVGLLSFQKGVASDAIEFKGLEVVRTDTLPITRQFQKQVYESILRHPERKEDFYIRMINRYKFMIYNDQIDMDQLILAKGVSKQPKEYEIKGPHVRVFEWMQKMGMEYYLGMKVPYYVVHADKVPRVAWEKDGEAYKRPTGSKLAVIHPSILKTTEWLNYDHYWDKLLFAPIERLLEKAFVDFDWTVFSSVEERKRTRKFEQIQKWFTTNIFEAKRKLSDKKIEQYYEKRKAFEDLVEAGYFKGFSKIEKELENFGTKVVKFEPIPF